MKKIFLLILFGGFTFLSVLAQSQTNVQSVLEKMATKIKSAKTVSTSFTLTQYNTSNQPTGTSKGLVKIKGNKYYLKQGTIEIFCDGSSIWNLDNKEVTIATVDDSDEDDITPQQVLSGFDQKDFTAILVSSVGTDYEVSLKPVDKRKNFKQVELFINKTTNLVSKARITDKTNNVTLISFSAITLNSAIADNQFVFDATQHPGVEVINQ